MKEEMREAVKKEMRKAMKREIRNAAVMILAFVLIGTVMTGCSAYMKSQRSTTQETEQVVTGEETKQGAAGEETKQGAVKEETKSADKDTAAAETEEETAQAAESYEDNFAVDSEAAEAFAEKIKKAVAKKDLEALAELTAFPVYVGLPEAGVIETKEDFLKLGADAVFTEELLDSIEKADIKNFRPSMAGFPVSDGRTASINFGVADGKLAINGINY